MFAIFFTWGYFCYAAVKAKEGGKDFDIEDLSDKRYDHRARYNLTFIGLVCSLSFVKFLNCLMLLVRMPSKASCRSCLIFFFIMVRVIFSIWYFLMVAALYGLMGFTVYFWSERAIKDGAEGTFDKLKIHTNDINTVSVTIIEIFVTIVAAL